MDDLNGTNWTTMNAIGSGVGQFAQYVAPVAFDASGRIYVATLETDGSFAWTM